MMEQEKTQLFDKIYNQYSTEEGHIDELVMKYCPDFADENSEFAKYLKQVHEDFNIKMQVMQQESQAVDQEDSDDEPTVTTEGADMD